MASLSVQSQALDAERHSFNSHIETLEGTLALRDQQLMDVNTQLAQVGPKAEATVTPYMACRNTVLA